MDKRITNSLAIVGIICADSCQAVSPNTRRRPGPNRHTAFYGTGPETRGRPDGGASSLEPAPLRASSSWPSGISPRPAAYFDGTPIGERRHSVVKTGYGLAEIQVLDEAWNVVEVIGNEAARPLV